MVEHILTVIPCLNEEDYLERLVRQLVAAGKTLPMRIVIADGGSSDRTPHIARNLTAQNPNVLLLDNPKRAQGAAVNLAVAAYGDQAEFLIRIDAHADYPDDYCQTLIEEARKTGAASVVGAMNTAGKTWFQQAAAAAQNSKLGNGGSAHRIIGWDGKWADHGHHALMRIDAFRAVGGYDESFSHNEDAELDARLQKAGFKIWLTGKTALTYYPRSAPISLFRQHVRFGYGRARNILKHRAWPKFRQLAPAAVLPAVLLALLKSICWIAALPLALWSTFCLGYGIALSIKAGDIRIAAAGPAAMLMHFGWSIGFWQAMLAALWSRS
jgi:succinoglycan biosynthesis protein ExoA